MTWQPHWKCYDWEGELETAVMSWLLSRGINDPKKQRGGDTLKTPRVESKFVFDGFATLEHLFINQDTKEKFFDYGTGKLFLKIITNRTENDEHHAPLRSECRWAIQQKPEISAKMDYHTLIKIVESGTQPDIGADKNHDISGLSFDVILQIRHDKLTEPQPSNQ